MTELKPACNIRIYASLAEVLKMSIGASFISGSGLKKTLLSNRINNELLFINLVTVPAEGILIPALHKCVAVSQNYKLLIRLKNRYERNILLLNFSFLNCFM